MSAASAARRVLMVTGEYPPQLGGVGDYSALLTAALRRLGHNVTVLTGRSASAADETGRAVWREVRDWGPGAWRLVEQAVDDSQAQLVHIQYQAGSYQLKGAINPLPLWLRSRRPGLAVVTTFHDLRPPYLFPRAGPLRSLAVQMLLRFSHGAVFVDPADLMRAGPGPTRRWIPIGSNIPLSPPVGFDPIELRRRLGANGGPLVGYFGFLTASKGAETLLRALALLRERGVEARLVLIGATAGTSNRSDRTDETSTLGLARRLGVESHIQTTGYLAPSDVSAHLLACDVLALPYDDGASFRRGSLLAALEHGCPVVTTEPAPGAAGHGARSFVPGTHFLAVPPRDPSALADSLSRLASDQALRDRLSKGARELATLCSWQAIAEETSDLYMVAGRSYSASNNSH